jgi:PhoH-like ATPase
MGNNYIIDTNVIIADPYFAKSFENCAIYIPIHVLEELDKLKSREGNTGFRARQFFRYFKEIEKEGNLLEGVIIEKNVLLKTVIGNFVDKLPDSFDENYVDNKILALMLTDEYKEFILITNDISMRIKASSLGIKTFLMDLSEKHKLDDLYRGILELEVPNEIVKEFYSRGEIEIEKLGIKLIYPNQFVLGTTNFSYNKLIGRYCHKKNKIVKLKYENASIFGVNPKDIRQKFAIEALLDENIPFVTMTARQGCGKTLLAIAAAMEQVLESKEKDSMLIGKNTSPIDKWSYQGYTTGDTEEKLLTHFGNYITTFENIQSIRGKKGKTGLEVLMTLKNQNKLDVLDISSILGSSFINKFVVIDEAQSFDVHAMRSIITRIGENSKLVLIGDIGQQTSSRLDPDKSGLYAAIEWLKELPETAHITLNEVHRSGFVDKASRLFDEKLFG